jgi:isocitrate/isopropylmalate dehydrogenase
MYGQCGDADDAAPDAIDVVLSTNMFGDILSDAAAALVGLIG